MIKLMVTMKLLICMKIMQKTARILFSRVSLQRPCQQFSLISKIFKKSNSLKNNKKARLTETGFFFSGQLYFVSGMLIGPGLIDECVTAGAVAAGVGADAAVGAPSMFASDSI